MWTFCVQLTAKVKQLKSEMAAQKDDFEDQLSKQKHALHQQFAKDQEDADAYALCLPRVHS